MTTDRRQDIHDSYRLVGGPQGAVALDDGGIETRVEDEWYSPNIPRRELKALMQRSDLAGLMNFGPWLVLLLASGGVAYVAWGSWWAIPAFLVYGTLYTSSDAHWHECAHGTAFRSRWLNEGFYHLLSFMCLREAYLWRWSHARHHTHTMMVGRDPEITVPRPANLPGHPCGFPLSSQRRHRGQQNCAPCGGDHDARGTRLRPGWRSAQDDLDEFAPMSHWYWRRRPGRWSPAPYCP